MAALRIAPLTQNIVKGFLQRRLGSQVNNVNAAYIAEQRGITIQENKTTAARGFTNLITVELKDKNGVKQVAGTLLNGLGPRIVKVDEYSMDVVPEGHLLLVYHTDEPGAIGRVGNLLAEKKVNIATMQVGRAVIGGSAIMMLTIDRPLNEDELAQVRETEGFDDVIAVDL